MWQNLTPPQYRELKKFLTNNPYKQALVDKVAEKKLCPYKFSLAFKTDERLEKYLQVSAYSLAKALGHVAIHVPNEGKMHVIAGRKAKEKGVEAGVPDLLILDLNLAIELKTGYNTPSEVQYAYLKKLRKIGWAAYWADSLDEVESIIKHIKKK